MSNADKVRHCATGFMCPGRKYAKP